VALLGRLPAGPPPSPPLCGMWLWRRAAAPSLPRPARHARLGRAELSNWLLPAVPFFSIQTALPETSVHVNTNTNTIIGT